MPHLVGIAGPSCSGKTELARWLAQATGAQVLNLDHYYIDLAHLPLDARAKTNFDEPHSVDHDAILDHARSLKAGRPIHAPQYNFATHTRAPGDEVIQPGRLVLLEGLFTLFWPALRHLLALKIYVHAPDEVCFDRRLFRDTRERGRTEASVRSQYAATVRPGMVEFIQPTRAFADLVLSGTQPIDVSGQAALRAIQDFLSHI